MRLNSITSPAPHFRSRVKGSQSVLKKLRQLHIANGRTLVGRELTEDEQKWHGRVHALVGQLIDEGVQVLPAFRDPRDQRRARKRPGQLF